MSDDRIFNGKKYRHYKIAYSRGEANQMKEFLLGKGYRVRVIKRRVVTRGEHSKFERIAMRSSNFQYDIYVRKANWLF